MSFGDLCKILASSLIVAAAAAILTGSVRAAGEERHQGTVVSAVEGQLVVKEQGEQRHVIADTTKITLNDQPANLSELQRGDEVTVTIVKEGKVITVAATRKPR